MISTHPPPIAEPPALRARPCGALNTSRAPSTARPGELFCLDSPDADATVLLRLANFFFGHEYPCKNWSAAPANSGRIQQSEQRAKAVKKNTRAAIWRTLQFSRAGMTVFFRPLNAATSSFGSRVQTLVVREGRESRGPREGESKPPPWPSGPPRRAGRAVRADSAKSPKQCALFLIESHPPPNSGTSIPPSTTICPYRPELFVKKSTIQQVSAECVKKL